MFGLPTSTDDGILDQSPALAAPRGRQPTLSTGLDDDDFDEDDFDDDFDDDFEEEEDDGYEYPFDEDPPTRPS